MSESIDYKQHTKSYLALRKTIGWIGILLPFVLLIGGIYSEFAIRPSISSYYHSDLRNVFFGSLSVIGVFLLFYSGFDHVDNIVANFAGIFAIGTAFFPTSECPYFVLYSTLHFICAAFLFITLAFFSLCLFTRSIGNESLNPFTCNKNLQTDEHKQKRRRNYVYLTCGFLMIALLFATLIVSIFISKEIIRQYSILFFIEAIMLIAFGMSWLTKGQNFLFKDKKKRENPLKKIKAKKRKSK